MTNGPQIPISQTNSPPNPRYAFPTAWSWFPEKHSEMEICGQKVYWAVLLRSINISGGGKEVKLGRWRNGAVKTKATTNPIMSSGIWMAFRCVLPWARVPGLYIPTGVSHMMLAFYKGSVTVDEGLSFPERKHRGELSWEHSAMKPSRNGEWVFWPWNRELGDIPRHPRHQASLGCPRVSQTQYAPDWTCSLSGFSSVMIRFLGLSSQVSYLPSTLSYIQLIPRPIEGIKLCLKSLEFIPISSFPPPLTWFRPSQPCYGSVLQLPSNRFRGNSTE